MQILPSFNPQPKESFGSKLGTGLSAALGQLAQNKVAQINQRNVVEQRAKAWESIGVPSNLANFIVQQPESMQKDIFDRLEGLNFGGQQGQQMQQESEPVVKSARESGVTLGLGEKARKLKLAEQKEINKQVFPYIQEVQKKANSAKENDMRLNRMEKLIDSGKLNNPQFASALKTIKSGIGGIFGHVGLDLEGLLSPESQEFNKLSADFVKSAKDIFGSRLTDTDLRTFLQTVPTLSQTNEGKKSVINNLKIMNKAAELKAKAARQLLKQYKGNIPLDFESEVDDLIKPELDALSEQFNNGFSGKSGKTSGLAGDVVGSLGQVLLGNN
jgi:hypothetical protein